MIERSPREGLPETFTSADDQDASPSWIDPDAGEGMDSSMIDRRAESAERSPWVAVGLVVAGGALAIAAISIRQGWVNFASFACLAAAWSQTRPQVLDDGTRVDHPQFEASSRKLIGVFAVLMAVLGLMEMVRG